MAAGTAAQVGPSNWLPIAVSGVYRDYGLRAGADTLDHSGMKLASFGGTWAGLLSNSLGKAGFRPRRSFRYKTRLTSQGVAGARFELHQTSTLGRGQNSEGKRLRVRAGSTDFEPKLSRRGSWQLGWGAHYGAPHVTPEDVSNVSLAA